jgi:hypothetical protein
MKAIWKYVPSSIGVFSRKTGMFTIEPVSTVIFHPPIAARVHPNSPIRGDVYMAEIVTPAGTRYYGFADGYITSRLKFAVKLLPGQERDEVVAKWKNAPARPARKASA